MVMVTSGLHQLAASIDRDWRVYMLDTGVDVPPCARHLGEQSPEPAATAELLSIAWIERCEIFIFGWKR